MSNEHKLGRPIGPSENRSVRPWDPQTLKYKERIALNYVAANPELYRWEIARHLKLSLSRLSILTCCDNGRAYLQEIKARSKGYLLPYKITYSALDTGEG